VLAGLGLTHPVLAAPMAGGPSTPALVVAAARAGSLGLLAAGYKTPQLLSEQIAEVRRQGVGFGVNVFAPNPVPVDHEAFARYAAEVQPDADRYGIDLGARQPREDDDHWAEKIELLLADPVPLVSFTFGLPDPATVDALRRAGTIVVQTVTSAAEAGQAEAIGVDALAVQAAAAGGHSGTFTPGRPIDAVSLPQLLGRVRARSRLPLLAAGGISTPADVAAALSAGASAVFVGTILLRADESGASAVHKAAVADLTRGPTRLTRAFTGRPARARPNGFMARHDAHAPLGYPAVHHLTSELRKAAAAAGDPELVNLWAGTGYGHASAEPVATILTRLAQRS